MCEGLKCDSLFGPVLLCSHWFSLSCLLLCSLPHLPVKAADQQCCAQMGDRDPRGHLQHADAASGAGGWEGQAGPHACQPDGRTDYGESELCLSPLCLTPLSYSHMAVSPQCVTMGHVMNFYICYCQACATEYRQIHWALPCSYDVELWLPLCRFVYSQAFVSFTYLVSLSTLSHTLS